MIDLEHHAALAVPDMEALVILATARDNEGLRKSGLSLYARSRLLCGQGQHCLFLAYIDSLVKTGMLVRLDHQFYITPKGLDQIEALRVRCRVLVGICL